MQFFSLSNANLYIAIVLSIVNGVLMCFASYKFFQMIQLSGYRIKGYFIWVRDNKWKYVTRMVLLSLLSAFCVLTTNALFNSYGNAMYSYIGLIFYFYFTIVFIIDLYRAPKKVPLKNTRRMNRLNVAMFLFVAVFSFFMIAISTEYFGFIRFGILCVVPALVPFFVPLVHAILIPLEIFIVTKYKLKAKHKLSKMPSLIKIGITGSFGKTSTKYILNTILSQKYKVCMSPHSFNTLPGLCKVVNNYLEENDEILITEMGARNVGDIKKLCNLISPMHGIITGIGSQHLQYFKSIDNILKTKNELIASLPKDGIAIFNSKNAGSKELFEKCELDNKILSYTHVKTGNISFDENGTEFTLYIGEKSHLCRTKLLGEHNVDNIVLCVELCIKLGLSIEQIVSGIAKLEPVPHRLELIKTDSNLILDDSYNASVEGSGVALDVLSQMKGRKVVVTPGLVELGKMEYEENCNLGRHIARVADKVVIVNDVNFKAIKEGLNIENYSEENIYQAPNLNSAQKLLGDFIAKGDCILFMNDLPDNYV